MAEAERQEARPGHRSPAADEDGRVPPVVIDIVLAVVVTAAVAFATAAKVEPEALDPDLWAYLFAVGLGGLMLVRRRWPAGVLITTMVLLFAYYTIGYPAVGVSVPVAGAVFSAAEQGRLRLAIVVAGIVMIVTTLYRLTEEPLAKLLGFEGAQNLVLLVAVIALGDNLRSRRELRRQSRLRAEQARLNHEAESRALVEQERLRIAREVHDVIAHSVSAISIQSVVGLEALPAEPDNAAKALRNIRQVSTTALADLRSAVGLLRDSTTATPAGLVPASGGPAGSGSVTVGSTTIEPAGLATAGLATAGLATAGLATAGLAQAGLAPAGLAPVAGLANLNGLVAAAADNGLQVTIRPADSRPGAAIGFGDNAITAPPELPVIVDTTAHRIVQESITNVLRHSDSDLAVVEINYRPTDVHLRISNPAGGRLVPAGRGRSIPAGGPAGGGFGIAGMRERVELLGGRLTAAPTDDGGFAVDAVLPLPVPPR